MDITKPVEYIELVVDALKSLDGSGRNSEILEKIVEKANLSDDQISELHYGGPQTVVSYQAGWARTYLGALGYLENSGNSVWSLTEKGYSEKIDKKDIYSKYRALKAKGDRKFKRTNKNKNSGENSVQPIKQNEVDEDAWIENLNDTLKKLSPNGFEKLCSRLFREKGFVKVEVTGKSGDGGIDGIGVMKLSLMSFKVLFQCKRYKESVGSNEIRDFRGGMIGRADKGIFLTTGRFTKSAVEEASRDGAEPIELIDGLALCELLKDLRMGIKTKEVFIVDNDWFEQYL